MFPNFNKPKAAKLEKPVNHGEKLKRLALGALAVSSMNLATPNVAKANDQIPDQEKMTSALLKVPKYDTSVISINIAEKFPLEFVKVSFHTEEGNKSALINTPNGNMVVQLYDEFMPGMGNDNIYNINGMIPEKLAKFNYNRNNVPNTIRSKDFTNEEFSSKGFVNIEKVAPGTKELKSMKIVVKDISVLKGISLVDDTVHVSGRHNLAKHPEVLKGVLKNAKNTEIYFKHTQNFKHQPGAEDELEGYEQFPASDNVLAMFVDEYTDFANKNDAVRFTHLLEPSLMNGGSPDGNFAKFFRQPKSFLNGVEVELKTITKNGKYVNSFYVPVKKSIETKVSANKNADYNPNQEITPSPRAEQVIQSDFIVENKNEDTNHAQLIEMKATLWKGLLQQGPRNIEIKLNISSSALSNLGADGFGYEMSINGAPAQQVFKTSQTTNNIYTIVLPKVQRGDRIVLTQMMFKGDVHIQVPNPTVNQFTAE